MNGVYETTTTSGTGTVTLSAVTGRPRFSSVAAVGDLVPYAMKDGNDWEWGMGTVSATNTLARSVILATYVSGTYDNTSPTAITLSGGTVDVYLAPVAEAISPGMPVVSSAYGRKGVFSPAWSTYPSTTLGVTADRIYLMPFKVDSAYDINGFYVRMTVSGAASTKARIGLYRMKSDGQPGSLVCGTADIDTSVAAAVLSPAVTQVRVNPGWYYIAIVCSGTPTFVAYPSNAYCVSPLGLSNGAADIVPIQFLYKTIAGWSALPTDPVSFSSLVPGTAAFPAIALKLV